MSDATKWNLAFKNVSLEMCENFKRDKKKILCDISGEFKQFELSAIVGKSGSGKTSLLNILSTYSICNYVGTIQIDGSCVSPKIIQKNSSYIMQENNFYHYITVRESMMFTVNCKFYARLEPSGRNNKITAILEELGLTSQENTFVGDLSGGEQKRLSIALELIDDPKILFIDEPTSGIDYVTSTQCILLLKKLAMEGRNIICTIHQPSSMIFRMFDHIYALADGQCVYQGSSDNLVPFLSELALICPPTYNPADFLLEICNNDYGDHNQKLVEKSSNGKNLNYRQQPQCHHLEYPKYDYNYPALLKVSKFHRSINEIFQLTSRYFLNNSRDRTLMLMRFGAHLVLGIFIGFMYFGIGQEISNIWNVYKFLFFNVFVLMFAAFSSLQTTFPLELPIIKRECFNKTYSALSYFVALTISDIPIILLTNLIYVLIAYIMTNQPMELNRFMAYLSVILMLSLASQSLGLIAGSLFNVKFTLILGSFFMCPFVLFSNFFILMKDSKEIFHTLFNLSFIKYAFEGSLQAIFGFDREKMSCNKNYCHFQWPHKFLEFLDVSENFYAILIKLFVFTLAFRLIAFSIMYVRLKR